MDIDERKSRVLQAIIQDYVQTAEPVGSRTLARKYRFGLSPATIRNEMSDLEELGYLEQPHTSAGRVPSSQGYRYYVDRLMEEHNLEPEEERAIEAAFQRRIHEIDALIQVTARLLSDATHYAALVSGPRAWHNALEHLQIIPLPGNKAMLVLVTESGMVEKQVIDIPEVTLVELQHVSEAITSRLRGQALAQVSRTTLQDLRRELGKYRALLDHTLAFLDNEQADNTERVYIGGTRNILDQPEFRDVGKVRTLLEVLEQEKAVQDLLGEPTTPPGEGVSFAIGEEIQYREMQDCSVITATYRIGGRTIGRIGVLGPRRMEYAKVAKIVDEVARRLTDAFGD